MSMSPCSTAATRRRSLFALALGASTAALVLDLAPAALAAPGDNGDVKIHESTTAVTDQRDEPKVCSFYLDAFNFDVLQQVSYTIDQQPPTGTQQVLSGSIILTNGTGHTGNLSLPDGHYKLTWQFEGEVGSAKHKTFMVDCTTTPSPSPSGSPSGGPSGGTGAGTGGGTGGASGGTGPIGSMGTGGGGSMHGPDVAEIAAGSALLAGAAGLGIRTARRRSARNAAS